MADKVVKCVLLDVDNVIITEIEEVMPEPGEPDCRLVNPYLFVSEDDMRPWVKASNQKEYMVKVLVKPHLIYQVLMDVVPYLKTNISLTEGLSLL